MDSYDHWVLVEQPRQRDFGETYGLVEDYLSSDHYIDYDMRCSLAFRDGVAYGRAIRWEYTAEELFIMAHEFEHYGLNHGMNEAFMAIKYGL